MGFLGFLLLGLIAGAIAPGFSQILFVKAVREAGAARTSASWCRCAARSDFSGAGSRRIAWSRTGARVAFVFHAPTQRGDRDAGGSRRRLCRRPRPLRQGERRRLALTVEANGQFNFSVESE